MNLKCKDIGPVNFFFRDFMSMLSAVIAGCLQFITVYKAGSLLSLS